MRLPLYFVNLLVPSSRKDLNDVKIRNSVHICVWFPQIFFEGHDGFSKVQDKRSVYTRWKLRDCSHTTRKKIKFSFTGTSSKY